MKRFVYLIFIFKNKRKRKTYIYLINKYLQLVSLYNLLYFFMQDSFLLKRTEAAILQRKQTRRKLFHLNRSYLKQHNQFLRNQITRPFEDYSQIHSIKLVVCQEYQVIIDTFPAASFELNHMPKLISILNSPLLIQQYKSVLGIDSLKQFFSNDQNRHDILGQNIVEKLVSLLKKDSSLLIFKSLSILKNLALSIKEHQQFHNFMNWKIIDFQVIIKHLYSKYTEIRISVLIFVKCLIERKFKFQIYADKRKLYQNLKCLTQKQINPISRIQYELIMDIIEKDGVYFGKQKFNNIQLVCQIQLKLLQKHKGTKQQNYYLARISRIIVGSKFIREFNKTISLFTFEKFQQMYPFFNLLIHFVFLKETLINNQKIIFPQENQLKKLVSYKNIFFYFVRLNMLQKLKISFLSQSLDKHSQDWSVAISCLILIEKLFQKKYICFIQSFTQDSSFYFKIQELYTVHHEYLRKQLNNTLNSMIRTKYSQILYKLSQHTFIRLYLTSLYLYQKNTIKVAISSLKKSILKLKENEVQSLDNNICSFVKNQILFVQKYLGNKARQDSCGSQIIQSYSDSLKELIL